MTYSFLNEEDPDYAIKAQVTPLTETYLNARCKSAERWLNSRCKGLLEVHHRENESLYFSGEVDFLHRTVRDFLCTGVLSRLFEVTEYEAFDVNLELCKSFLTQMKSLKSISDDKRIFTKILDSFLLCARRFEQDKRRAPTELLDSLDQTAWKLYGAQISPSDHWTNHIHKESDKLSYHDETTWGKRSLLLDCCMAFDSISCKSSRKAPRC